MRSEWKSLGIQLHHIFGLPISRPCQIVLFIIADSTDDFNPSVRHIGNIANMAPGNIVKYFKTLASLNYIVSNGKDNKGRSKWLINIETIRPLVCHLTSYPTDNTSSGCYPTDNRGCYPTDNRGVIPQITQTLKNPKINPKEVAREALPPPSQSDKVLKLVSQTPKDLEENPAKKKTKSKLSQKPKLPPWEADHPYSEIFTLLCRLEPYKAIFDLSKDTKIIDTHMTVRNWNIAQMTFVVRLFVSKSIGTEHVIKSPRRTLATYVANGEKWNSYELEKLRNQNSNNPSGMKGIEDIDY